MEWTAPISRRLSPLGEPWTRDQLPPQSAERHSPEGVPAKRVRLVTTGAAGGGAGVGPGVGRGISCARTRSPVIRSMATRAHAAAPRVRTRPKRSVDKVHLVDGQARAYALELGVAGVTDEQPPADLLVEVFEVARLLGLGMEEGEIVLE